MPKAPRAEACAIATPGGQNAKIATETALIVYDSASKTEHFLRTAKFDSTGDFGFFVPTPTRPQLAEAPGDIFPQLAKLTAPAKVYRTVYHESQIACMPSASNQTFIQVGSAIKPSGSSVRVIEQTKIGEFDAVVLKADEPAALQSWLSDNKYKTRPALEAWFGEYLKLGWYITAFKISAGTGRGSEDYGVRISFETDRPVYPYREPSDQGESWRPRLLRVFVASDARVEGSIGSGADASRFAGRTVWSKPVDARSIGPVLGAAKLPVRERNWHLTEFEDESSLRLGSDDLFFSNSESQGPIERTPLEIVVHKTTYWGEGSIYAGAVLFAFMAMALARRSELRKRRGIPPQNGSSSSG